jgi:hypothetical protein
MGHPDIALKNASLKANAKAIAAMHVALRHPMKMKMRAWTPTRQPGWSPALRPLEQFSAQIPPLCGYFERLRRLG